MLLKLGSLDESVYFGNTILLKIIEESNKNRYVYIGGDKIYSFITNDHTPKYNSNKGNNMIPYSIAVVEGIIYFLSPHFKNIKRANVKDEKLLKTNEISVNPFD